MSARLAGYGLSLALATFLPEPATALQVAPDGAPREGRVPIGETSLYVREVGCGLPVIVLHGGPDFDHRYLLPELDRLAESLHLIYYDQRGRGRSAHRVEPDEVTLASDVEDIERLRCRTSS